MGLGLKLYVIALFCGRYCRSTGSSSTVTFPNSFSSALCTFGISRACAHIVKVTIFPRAHYYNTQCTAAVTDRQTVAAAGTPY